MQPLGKALKQIREDLGLSQEQMASELSSRGLSITTKFGVCRLEERGTTQYAVLKAYADIANKSIEEIESSVEKISQPV